MFRSWIRSSKFRKAIALYVKNVFVNRMTRRPISCGATIWRLSAWRMFVWMREHRTTPAHYIAQICSARRNDKQESTSVHSHSSCVLTFSIFFWKQSNSAQNVRAMSLFVLIFWKNISMSTPPVFDVVRLVPTFNFFAIDEYFFYKKTLIKEEVFFSSACNAALRFKIRSSRPPTRFRCNAFHISRKKLKAMTHLKKWLNVANMHE